MDTLGFYHHEHELTNVNHMEFKFDNFFDMSEVPIPKNIENIKETIAGNGIADNLRLRL